MPLHGEGFIFLERFPTGSLSLSLVHILSLSHILSISRSLYPLLSHPCVLMNSFNRTIIIKNIKVPPFKLERPFIHFFYIYRMKLSLIWILISLLSSTWISLGANCAHPPVSFKMPLNSLIMNKTISFRLYSFLPLIDINKLSLDKWNGFTESRAL